MFIPQTAVAWGSHYLLKIRGWYVGAHLVLTCDLDPGVMGSKCENATKMKICLSQTHTTTLNVNLFCLKLTKPVNVTFLLVPGSESTINVSCFGPGLQNHSKRILKLFVSLFSLSVSLSLSQYLSTSVATTPWHESQHFCTKSQHFCQEGSRVPHSNAKYF